MARPTIPAIAAVFLLVSFAGRSSAQEKVFDWLPANDESVRLDPANYHTGRTYRPGSSGGDIHVGIQAQNPVTIFLAREGDWNLAVQHPDQIAKLRMECPREHVVDTVYLCHLPPEPMTLVVADERNNPDQAVFAGLGAVLDPDNKTDRAMGRAIATVLTGSSSVTRTFKSPNDIHIQYFRWDCVQNCIQPEFRWVPQFQEKYEISSRPKIYGGYKPETDGEKVSVRIKSPVPMAVALLPSQVANRLYAEPDLMEPALEKSNCQQRGVQNLQFECAMNIADGPQSLVIVPEDHETPKKKKAEVDMQAVKCAANCNLLAEGKQ